MQKMALDLISLALKAGNTPAAQDEDLSLQADTGVLVVRATEPQHAVIAEVLRILKESTSPAIVATSAPAQPIVRIYALGRIFGAADSGSESHQKERTAKTEALISQIRTSLAMARLDVLMPELSFHGSSNSLIAKGTAAQIDLISQAVRSWRENTPDHRPSRGP